MIDIKAEQATLIALCTLFADLTVRANTDVYSQLERNLQSIVNTMDYSNPTATHLEGVLTAIGAQYMKILMAEHHQR